MADKKAPSDETPAPESTVDRMERLVLKFMELGQQNALTPAALKEILQTAGSATAEGMQKAITPENKHHLNISAFFTAEDKANYGDLTKKPKLKRDTFFNYHKENEEQLTVPEILAYNSIDEDYEQRNGQLVALIKQRGRKREELHITLPVKDMDHRFNAPPSLLLLVHELKTGQQVGDMQDVLSEIALLRERLLKYEKPDVTAKAVSSSKVLVGGGPLVSDLEAALDATPVAALAR